MLDRNWAMLLVDTPGRGSSIYLKGIKTRPDYEVPGKACIDYSPLTAGGRCRSHRAARHQHGGLLRAARGGVRKTDQGFDRLERLLQRPRRPLRFLRSSAAGLPKVVGRREP